MKRSVLSILAALGLIAGLMLSAPTASATAGNHGTFWVYDGANATGQWRGFDVYPNRTQTFSPGATTRYTGGGTCGTTPSTCGYLNNTISSIQLSCGSVGFLFETTDWVDFYNLDIPSGTAYRITRGTRQCINGNIIINFDSTHTNWAGSMVTHDG